MKVCLTCGRKLKPGTSIPRWSEEMLASSESTRRSYDSYVAQRKREIDEERLGLYGESQFCNKDCACFFARATVMFIQAREEHVLLAHIQRILLKCYQWVADRKAGK